MATERQLRAQALLCFERAVELDDELAGDRFVELGLELEALATRVARSTDGDIRARPGGALLHCS